MEQSVCGVLTEGVRRWRSGKVGPQVLLLTAGSAA